MVFSSFPVYLDHPNLHQFQQQAEHHQHHGAGGIDISSNNGNGQLPPVPSPVPPPPPPHHVVVGGAGAGGGSSIRPGSMVDRARLAKLPLPEAGLKCPRCDSTNTKFCYFNNYSLTQPRHFCKTCRRYWTRGGALRNVPVGGGCRRNKKSKSGGSSSSKSSASSDHHRPINGNNNNINNNNNNNNNNSASTASPSSCTTDMVGHHHHHHFGQPSTQLPLMAALHNLHNQYGVVGSGVGGFQAQMVAAANGGGFNLEGGAEQWRLPTCIGAGFESGAAGATNLFPFHGEGVVVHDQAAPMVKSEETPHSGGGGGGGINLTKQFFVNSDNNQFWGANSGGGGSGGGSPWTGFSGLNSSSTGHHLL